MPTYRTSLTFMAACLLAANAAHAQGPAGGGAENGAASDVKRGYITVEETVGAVPALRQTIRLDMQRAVLLPLDADNTTVAMPVIEQPLKQPQPVSTVAIADKAAIVDVALSQGAVPAVFPSARRSEQDVSEVSARVVELVRDGMLRPEHGAELVAKLNGLQSPVAVPVAARASRLETDAPIALARPIAVLADVAEATVPDVPSVAAVDVAAQATTPQGVVVAEPQAVSFAETLPTQDVSTAAMPVAQPEPIKLASAEPMALPTLLASAAVATPIQESTNRVWTLAREDRTVRTAIERWARQVEWQLSWELTGDFQIEFNADFDGEFIDAVSRVVDALSDAERPLRAEFYKGNRVLRILSGRQ